MYFSGFFGGGGGMKPNANEKKNKANVNWNCSKASLCGKDMHEFILE